MIEKSGIIHFHQGWTDIINCLAMIDYYIEKYNNIILLLKYDANNVIEYYLKYKKNIEIIYYDYSKGPTPSETLINNNINEYDIERYDILFHGGGDDGKNKYKCCDLPEKRKNGGFANSFYEEYGIDPITRVKYFNFYRDKDTEEKVYQNFIKKYGKNYILHHEIDGSLENKEISYVNLNKISDTFFDYIKVLENSIEFHLLDSCWGALIYILDSKYGLFKDKKVFLYAKRGYTSMFTEPLLLPNWQIIK